MSANLNLEQVTENQTLKEVSINTATGQLDAALTETRDADFTAGNITLTATQYRAAMRHNALNVTTAGRTLTLPAVKKLSIFTSGSGNTQSLDIIKGSSTYTLGTGSVVILYTDGTANGLEVVGESGAAAIRPYDIGLFCAGLPAASEKLLRYVYVRSVDLAAALAGSSCKAGTAATAQTDFTLKKNGVSMGTIRFAAAGTVATYVGVSATSFVSGDILELTAPGSQDATLADISFTIAGVQV